MKELANKAESVAQGFADKQKEELLKLAVAMKELVAKGEAWAEGHEKNMEDAQAETRSMTEEFTVSLRSALEGGKDTEDAPPSRDVIR